jgi:hypothetical protein
VKHLFCIIALFIECFSIHSIPVQAQSQLAEPTCNLTARINGASASAVLVTHGGGSIRVCAYSLDLGLNATTSAQLVWGTGSTCGTNTVDLSPILQIGSTVTGNDPVITAGDGWGFLDEAPVRALSDLCLLVTGSSPKVNGIIRYEYL